MSEQLPQSIRKLPAARGLKWVSGSWGLIKRQTIRLLLISLFFQFFLSFSQMGALGMVVVLCLPVLSAGLLQAFYIVQGGDKPMLAVLFMPFTAKGRTGSLLLLGAVAMVVALMVVTLLLAGQVMEIDPDIMARVEQGDLDALQLIDPQVLQSAVYAMVIGATISGTLTYFSIPLIWFRNHGLGSALMTGLKGLVRNWKPLLVLGLFLGLLAVPIAMLFGYFYFSALTGGSASTLLGFLLLLIGPLFQLLLFGSQYLAFMDVFDMDEAIIVISRPDDQLVA
jgi:hypothetical protein